MTKTLNALPFHPTLKVLSLFIISLSLISCNYEYVQILRTQSSGLAAKKEGWVFENDSVKISYNFNSRGGLMAFKLYNKLNRPLYLDWKNSSFIYNGEKNNYWIEETNTVGSSISSTKVGKNTFNAYDRNVYGLTIGLLSQKSVKAERVTFIPPKSGISSNISYYQFRLTNSDRHFRIDPTKATKLMVKDLSSRKEKQIRGYFHTYNDSNSIITFRNYLAITFSENSNQFTFIDNKFYVSSLEEVDNRCLNELPKEGTVFYIDGIQEYESAHSRDRSK